jgi:3alpha(or 20beta)-hydroxysteroid dehydrogenase
LGNRVAGKVALITGGARGQGAAHGELLAEEGAAVILADVRDELGEATRTAGHLPSPERG